VKAKFCNSNLSGVKADQMVFNHHQKLGRVFIALFGSFSVYCPGHHNEKTIFRKRFYGIFAI